jgi:hypothetical protein
MILEGLLRPVVAAAAVLVLGYLLYLTFLSKSNVPLGLPWLGWKPGVLAHFRASINGVLHNHEIFEEGYHQVGKSRKV